MYEYSYRQDIGKRARWAVLRGFGWIHPVLRRMSLSAMEAVLELHLRRWTRPCWAGRDASRMKYECEESWG